ncbi:MAG: flagellar basal-body rod protein FlgG [Candidatus Dadabacteria bacterium]|nr:MAG: flagellar basal-body rod protein FlgG [Candidatus Dadabacteria bacterium]
MIRALYTSATGMNAQETNIDVIANNLANVNTTSYKKSRADFQDLVYQYLIEPGAKTSANTSSPSGIQIGLGVKPSAVKKVFLQGDLTSTGNQLDLAIEGDGFFQVQLPDGSTAYTRAGSFQLDDTGQIVTPDGYVVDPGITIPTDALSITVGQDGTVSVRQPGSTTASQVGQLTAVRFANNAGLRAVGRNLYEETESSGTPTTGIFGENGVGRLSQGFLETSNVSVVEEVVNMITAQRAYEASSRGINAADEMLNQAINLRR